MMVGIPVIVRALNVPHRNARTVPNPVNRIQRPYVLLVKDLAMVDQVATAHVHHVPCHNIPPGIRLVNRIRRPHVVMAKGLTMVVPLGTVHVHHVRYHIIRMARPFVFRM